VDPNYTTAKNRKILSFVRPWGAAGYVDSFLICHVPTARKLKLS